MIILSHGQSWRRKPYRITKKFINKTVFEIVAFQQDKDLHKRIRDIDPNCELIQDEPVDVSGRKRFIFSTEMGELIAENVLRHLAKPKTNLKIFEFQIASDLEAIFLRATKKNWEEKICLAKRTEIF